MVGAWDSPDLTYVSGGTTGIDVGRGVVVDASGNIYFAGFAAASTNALPFSIADSGQYSCQLDGCQRHVFVAKLLPTGNLAWLRLFEGSGNQANRINVSGLALDSSNKLVIGGTFAGTFRSDGISVSANTNDTDGYAAKIDTTNGNLDWLIRIEDGSSDLALNDVDVASSGNIVLAGHTSGPVSMGALTIPVGAMSGQDGFLIRLSADGSPAWGVRFGGSSDDYTLGAAIAPSGHVYVAGAVSVSATISPTYLPGGATRSAETPLSPETGSSDAFIAKFSADGDVDTTSWPLRFGGSGEDHAYAIDVDSTTVAVASFVTGTVTIGASTHTSNTTTNNDVFVTAFDVSGNPRWSSRLVEEPDGDDQPRGVVLAANGDIITTGHYGASKLWFVSRHTAIGGSLSWFTMIGDLAPANNNNDIGQKLAIDSAGNIYSVGRFDGGQVDPYDTSQLLATRGGADALLISLRSNGSMNQGVELPTVAAPAVTPIGRVTLDANGGTCTLSSPPVFVGFTYLPGPSDCARAGYTFGGWANTSTPNVVRSFPLLTDPSDGQRRYFVAEHVNLIAIWTPLATPPDPITDLTVFANFFCGPCTNAWLLFTLPVDATDFAVTVNDSATTCAQKGNFFGLALCEIIGLAPGPTTFAVTPLNDTTPGAASTVSVTMRP